MDIRLVAVDLDDTLLSPEGSVSQANLEAVRDAVEKGVYVVVCTGRMFCSARRFGALSGVDLPVVACNGAVIRRALSGDVLRHAPVPVEVLPELVPLLRKRGAEIRFYVGDRIFFEKDTGALKEYLARTEVEAIYCEDLLELEEKGCVDKVLAVMEPDAAMVLRGDLSRKFEGRLYVTRSYPHFLEVLNVKATKGDGLGFVASSLGVRKEEIMALGDGFNDLELFEGAGFRVAMGNAQDKLKEAADFVTLGNDSDGVAYAIRRFVL